MFAKQADAVSRRIVPFVDRAGLEVGVQEFRNLIQDFSVDDDELLELVP